MAWNFVERWNIQNPKQPLLYPVAAPERDALFVIRSRELQRQLEDDVRVQAGELAELQVPVASTARVTRRDFMSSASSTLSHSAPTLQSGTNVSGRASSAPTAGASSIIPATEMSKLEEAAILEKFHVIKARYIAWQRTSAVRVSCV